MITYPTVFILGAGASMPYGFPSGKELVNRICKSVSSTDPGLVGTDVKTMVDFADELRWSGYESVDAFLEHRREFVELGKRLIAMHLISP